MRPLSDCSRNWFWKWPLHSKQWNTVGLLKCLLKLLQFSHQSIFEDKIPSLSVHSHSAAFSLIISSLVYTSHTHHYEIMTTYFPFSWQLTPSLFRQSVDSVFTVLYLPDDRLEGRVCFSVRPLKLAKCQIWVSLVKEKSEATILLFDIPNRVVLGSGDGSFPKLP
jgi:hypothetical protein